MGENKETSCELPTLLFVYLFLNRELPYLGFCYIDKFLSVFLWDLLQVHGNYCSWFPKKNIFLKENYFF